MIKKFNASRIVKKSQYVNINVDLEKQNKDFNIDSQDDPQNINLKLPVKDEDGTILVEKKLEANRSGDTLKITEKALNTEIKIYNKKRFDEGGDVMPINLISQSYDTKHADAITNAETINDFDTKFWDKYVGLQKEEDITKIKVNTESRLLNSSDRFTKKDPSNIEDVINVKLPKVASSILKDADAMLFHIYASVNKTNRILTDDEQQIIIDINANKMRVLAQSLAIENIAKEDALMDIKRENTPDVLSIDVQNDGSVNVIEMGRVIDTFSRFNTSDENIKDATQSYYPDLS